MAPVWTSVCQRVNGRSAPEGHVETACPICDSRVRSCSPTSRHINEAMPLNIVIRVIIPRPFFMTRDMQLACHADRIGEIF